VYALRYKWFWIGTALLMVAVLTILSLQPVAKLPKVDVSDKLLHFIAYFFLTSWFVGFIKTGKYLILGIVILVFSFAIEVVQGLSKYRQFEWLDLLANGVGIAVALALGYWLLKGWSQKLENKFSQ